MGANAKKKSAAPFAGDAHALLALIYRDQTLPLALRFATSYCRYEVQLDRYGRLDRQHCLPPSVIVATAKHTPS
jgi:hypothetical protein